jgi:phenylalanyl-tRNA synthetase beta subunit
MVFLKTRVLCQKDEKPMRVVMSWLNDHGTLHRPMGQDLAGHAQAIAAALTASGSEALTMPATQWAKAFWVAEIAEVQAHPQADSLSVCQVNDGSGQLRQVVCGARNVRKGMKTILAKPGSVLPGTKAPLESCRLRGVESQGMLCSASELWVEDLFGDEDGIIDLQVCGQEGAIVGQALFDLLPADWVIELEITPNRGDLLSHQGIMRELAGLGLATMAPCAMTARSIGWASMVGQGPSRDSSRDPGQNSGQESAQDQSWLEAPAPASAQISQQMSPYPAPTLATPDCPLMALWAIDLTGCAATVSQNNPGQNNAGHSNSGQSNDQGDAVEAGQSQIAVVTPAWMRRRLLDVGVKTHFPAVDITNYSAFDVGQPLHAFDGDLIQGQIMVRGSKAGESFEALDGTLCHPAPGCVVIADDAGIISLAGVMGGARTACRPSTRRVVLEAAYFEPKSIARAGQASAILSQARSRFERGVDPMGVVAAGSRAVQWLCSALGAHCSGPHISGQAPQISQSISLSLDLVQQMTGAQLDAGQQIERMQGLGATCTQANSLDTAMVSVQPPSWRHDWHTPQDCVEEILRLNGYQDINSCGADFSVGTLFGAQPPGFVRCEGEKGLDFHAPWAVRRFCVAQGLFETVNWSFCSQADCAFFAPQGLDPDTLRLSNPMTQDQSALRPSLVPHLLSIYRRHQSMGILCPGLFEVGPCFFGPNPQDQHTVVSVFLPIHGAWDWQRGQLLSIAASAGQDKNSSVRLPSKADLLPDACTFYDVKAMAEALMRDMGLISALDADKQAHLGRFSWRAGGPQWGHPGQSAVVEVWHQGQSLGDVGMLVRLHPRLGHEAFVFSLDLSGLARTGLSVGAGQNQSLTGQGSPSSDASDPHLVGPSAGFTPSLQPVYKDLSFFLPPDLPVGQLLETLVGLEGLDLADLQVRELIDLPLASGRLLVGESGSDQPCDTQTPDEGGASWRRSITVRAAFQPTKQTWTADQLMDRMEALVCAAATCGASLRGSLAP